MPTMKTPHSLPSSALCVALSALCIVHSALSIAAAEPPPAASQEGVQLWEGGPFWADRNVGAEEPWESGLFFWWGDTVGYKHENDKWMPGDGTPSRFSFTQLGGLTPTFGKDPETLRREGWTTQGNVLAPEHDAASAHWGGTWRMPTKREMDDFRDKCDWTWTTTNGVKGFVVRGRGEYSSASIFLPASGYGQNLNLFQASSWGNLWAGDPRLGAPPTDRSWRLRFGWRNNSSHIGVNAEWDRHIGAPVRPVRGTPALPEQAAGAAATPAASSESTGKNGPIIESGEHRGVRLWNGGPYWADRNVGAEEPSETGLYFWWGDSVGYKRENDAWVATDGSSSRFSFCQTNTPTFKKHIPELREEGWVTNVALRIGGWVVTNEVLTPAHDPAQIYWGGGWRMPTRQELVDLGYNMCDWTWTTTNGVNGFLVRGRGDYASAALFLPTTGLGLRFGLTMPGYGDLYASDPRTDAVPGSWRLEYGRRDVKGTDIKVNMDYHWDRFLACPVRPVIDSAE